MQLNDMQLWALVASANWTSDHDYDRIKDMYMKLPEDEHKQLEDFVDSKCSDLHDKYKEDWLGNPGINVSDDGWMDLRAEVVGRGQNFYENITVEKLREMAEENDYHENFQYSLHKD